MQPRTVFWGWRVLAVLWWMAGLGWALTFVQAPLLHGVMIAICGAALVRCWDMSLRVRKKHWKDT